MKKKLLAVLLSFVMVLSLAPAVVLVTGVAAEAEEVTFDSVQAIINALPDAQDITEENMSDVEAQLDAIDAAKTALYQAGGDVDSLDMSKYDAACEALAALSGSGGSSTPSLTATGTKLTSSGGTLTSGSYYLDGNVTLTKDITIYAGSNVTIDLNGFTLTGTGTKCVITVDKNATFTLTDGSTDGTGVVTNGSGSSGGGISTKSGSTFTMNGGTISGNTASSGGGVHVNGGTFTMNGGEISGNTATSGGGVYLSGSKGVFTMTGGTISGNSVTSNYCGGVYVVGGTFNMQGGTISGNTGPVGGGVYVSTATFNMSGGTISENSGSNGGGVNVSASGKFNMSGGTISENSAASGGGGVFVASGGKMTMSGGQITENTATSSGGGVHAVGKNGLTISGSPVISGNTGKGTTQNVYLNTNQITLGGELTAGASIGVTTGTSLDPGESVQITTETGGYEYYLNALACFHSDNSYYIVQTNTSGYLELYSMFIPGSVTISGDAVYGQELTAVLSTDVPENVAYQWLRDGTAISGATASTYTLTAEDIGSVITVQVTHADYTGSLTASTDTVQKATLAPSFSGATSKVYDGAAASNPTVSITLVGSDADYTETFVWYSVADDGTESELTDAPTDVGSYKVVVTIDAGDNYETASISTDFTIEVAEQSISYAAPTMTKHINDTAFTNTLTQATVYGGISYASSNTSVAIVDENGQVTIVGAGSANITATAASSSNYNGATASYSLTVTDHSYVEKVVAATYTEQGYTLHTCEYCDESYQTDFTDILVLDGTDSSVTTQVTVGSLTALPDGLKGIYSSVDELTADLISKVTVTAGYTEENTAVYDVYLQYSVDGGAWAAATVDNFPTTGITVTLPYPDGTDASYSFTVLHMFTETSTRLGITAGETESPTVTKTDDGLVVTLTGLSPVAISWQAPTTTTTTTSAKTGDSSHIGLWIGLLAVSGVGIVGLTAYSIKRRRFS